MQRFKFRYRWIHSYIDNRKKYSLLLTLTEGNELFATGNNNFGQLGNFSTQSSSTFVKVAGFGGNLQQRFIQTCTGYGHSMALTSDGIVWSWSLNNGGQLGEGSDGNRHFPQKIELPKKIAEISCGGFHSLALSVDGSVYAWGFNDGGQCGDSTFENRNLPVKVHVNEKVKKISAGMGHSLALLDDGRVFAWGWNLYGQLGNGTFEQKVSIPFAVQHALKGKRIVQISAGNDFSLVLTDEGKIFGFGKNSQGQLGDGSVSNQPTPSPLYTSMSGFVAISAGLNHSVAVYGNFLFGWGSNTYFQLGLKDIAFSPKPVCINTNNCSIKTAIASNGNIIIKTQKSGLIGWGLNGNGQLGTGNTSSPQKPTFVIAETTNLILKELKGGDVHSLAVSKDGQLYGWGSGEVYQSGLSNPKTFIPSLIQSTSRFSKVSAGKFHSLALSEYHEVYAFGSNSIGQLGVVLSSDNKTKEPQKISSLANFRIVDISAGSFHNLALTDTGNVFAWGRNTSGELGDGTFVNRIFPIQVLIAEKIKFIFAGDNHNLAISDSGEIYVWGGNNCGQLGIDSNVEQANIPIKITKLFQKKERFVQVCAAGNYDSKEHHSMALTDDGTIYSWGSNVFGQLGVGSNINHQRIPGKITASIAHKRIIKIHCKNLSSIAISDSGQLFSWGLNNYGQLGLGTSTSKVFLPEVVQESTTFHGFVKNASLGYYHLLIETENILASTGNNYYGQLGQYIESTNKPHFLYHGHEYPGMIKL